VLRKRLRLVGGVESGQVTSFVRYLPGSSFHEHGHPEGEEIFVIRGTFSDHLGDAHEGTHLLNPEGFRHAPHSEPGCLILVKLRQYAGEGREFRRTQTRDMRWETATLRGIEQKILDEDDRSSSRLPLSGGNCVLRASPPCFAGGTAWCRAG
jgi:hypothetical protein